MEKFVIYLPIFAAVLWGASYAVFEKVFETVNVLTWLFIGGVFCVLVELMLHVFVQEMSLNFQPFLKREVLVFSIFALVLTQTANLVIWLSIQHTNATYAAVIEICYVIFVPVFSYLIFGYRNFNLSTLIGGAIIFAGVLVVIRGQSITQGAANATI